MLIHNQERTKVRETLTREGTSSKNNNNNNPFRCLVPLVCITNLSLPTIRPFSQVHTTGRQSTPKEERLVKTVQR